LALVPEVAWETPFGFDVTVRAGAGLLAIGGAAMMKPKNAKGRKRKRAAMFIGLGAVSGEAAVQAYKMKLSIFDAVGEDETEVVVEAA
jgi:hypothetical protein